MILLYNRLRAIEGDECDFRIVTLEKTADAIDYLSEAVGMVKRGTEYNRGQIWDTLFILLSHDSIAIDLKCKELINLY